MAKSEDSKGSKLMLKLLTILISIPVGRLVTKSIDRVWLAVRPSTPTDRDDAAAVQWKDALAWAALSAAGLAAAQLLTKRGAETAYRAILGTPPPPVATPAEKRLAKHLEKAETAVKEDAAAAAEA